MKEEIINATQENVNIYFQFSLIVCLAALEAKNSFVVRKVS